MQKQNPFLKPSPIFNNNYPSSYSPYPNNNKYPSYSSFDTSKPTINYDSYPNNMERLPQPPQPSKFKSTTDINDILRNNPFNRPPPSIFSASSATTHSPAKYQPSRNYQPYSNTSSYERPDLYPKQRANYSINDKPASYPQQSSRLTPKKHDNYLSTSSADSATTYINRIYQLQQEKPQGTSNLSNPFFRKNLISDKTYEREVANTNSYDNAALKYIAAHKEVPYKENNYFVAANQPKKTNNYESNSYKAYEAYGEPYKPYKQQPNTYEKGSKYDKYDANINTDKYQPTKYSKYQPKYQNYQTQNDKYQTKLNNYDKYQAKLDYTDKPTSKKDIYQPQYNPPQYDSVNSKYNFDEEDGYKKTQIKDQFDFSDKYNSNKYQESLRRDKYEESLKREKFQDSQQPNHYEENAFDHKYSFKPQYNLKEESKKSLQKIPQFGQSKSKIKEYPGQFQTLGGKQEYNKYEYSKPKQETYTAPVGSKKLISSQVEEYSPNPYQRENINPYQKPYEKQTKQKFKSYEQQQEQPPRYKSKGAVRDSSQGFPSILQYNGMVFYRIEVK